ncbi:hypothetical protein SDC9_141021 [bioreactor metagenome]|uniref:Uncharacterized protein n=1 Tax=bioreactor metagenome TaxID=1076179 RepID=A0A645DX88_9ZZZZ
MTVAAGGSSGATDGDRSEESPESGSEQGGCDAGTGLISVLFLLPELLTKNAGNRKRKATTRVFKTQGGISNQGCGSGETKDPYFSVHRAEGRSEFEGRRISS